MLWAYAKVSAPMSFSSLFDEAGDSTVALDDLGGFKEQELSNIIFMGIRDRGRVTPASLCARRRSYSSIE
jgi:hypothetical protein